MRVDTDSALLLAKLIVAEPNLNFNDTVLAWLKTYLAFDGVTTIAYFKKQRPHVLFSWSAHNETHSLLGTEYLQRAYLLDPLYDLHVRDCPRGVYCLSEIAPDQFQRTQYYKEYYQFTGATDEVGMLLRPSPGVTVIMSLDVNRRSGRQFPHKTRAKISTLFPILAALAEKHYSTINSGDRPQELFDKDTLALGLHEEHAISLSPRQTEVALLVLKGHSSISIGSILGISPQTVKVFRKQIYRRCGISSQAELFKLLLPLIAS